MTKSPEPAIPAHRQRASSQVKGGSSQTPLPDDAPKPTAKAKAKAAPKVVESDAVTPDQED